MKSIVQQSITRWLINELQMRVFLWREPSELSVLSNSLAQGLVFSWASVLCQGKTKFLFICQWLGKKQEEKSIECIVESTQTETGRCAWEALTFWQQNIDSAATRFILFLGAMMPLKYLKLSGVHKGTQYQDIFSYKCLLWVHSFIHSTSIKLSFYCAHSLTINMSDNLSLLFW